MGSCGWEALGGGDGLCDRALSSTDPTALGLVFFLRKGFDIEISLFCNGLSSLL